MNYQLKEKSNGEIDFIATAGSDFVKSSMPIGRAKGIIASGKVKVSDKFDGFGIGIDEKYYFAGTVDSDKPEPQQKTVSEKPKQEFFKKHNNKK